RVREQVRPQVLAYFALRELGEVVDELGFRVSPGEVRIRLREAGFRQVPHQRWPREGFRQENDVGVLRVHEIDHPFPEAEGLRVRIVDAEDANAALDPEQRDVEQCLPERLPFFALEVEWIDVL